MTHMGAGSSSSASRWRPSAHLIAHVYATGQGGGKRRAICGFVAKPSATRKPAALPCPHTCRVGACQVHVHGNVGCRTNTGASLHGPTADKHTLSLAPLPPIFAFNRFLDGPRRREAASSHLSFLANFDPDQCACS